MYIPQQQHESAAPGRYRELSDLTILSGGESVDQSIVVIPFVIMPYSPAVSG